MIKTARDMGVAGGGETESREEGEREEGGREEGGQNSQILSIAELSQERIDPSFIYKRREVEET